MKAGTMKYAGTGIASGLIALCVALEGCGGGNSSAAPSVATGNNLAVVCSNAANGARFQADDVGVGFIPAAANANGQIAGSKVVNGKTRTVVARNGAMTDIGLDNATPVTINNAGQVAGNTTIGFVWQSGQTTVLKNLPGGTSNFVLDMNNNGELVGAATTGQKNHLGSDVWHAAYWANAQAVPQDLGVLSAGDDQSQANSINDNGQIVGFSGLVLGKADYVYFASHSSTMLDMGLLAAQGGSFGYSELGTIFIGNSGLIVGVTFLNGVADSQVFLTKAGGSPTYFTTLRWASKPNSTDQFIAVTKADGFSLYESGKGVQDLLPMLPTGCSVTLKNPVAIADGGQIVANGTLNGADHGFLIRP